MKKILIAIVIIILIIIGILGFAFLNANKLIAQYKPELEHTLSGLIGAEIELRDISATVLPQTALKVSGLTIKNLDGKDEPGPAFNQFLLSLNLKALLAGRLDITQISILDPKLTLIKSSSGIRLQGLPAAKHSDPKSKDEAKDPVVGQQKPQSATELPTLPLAINLKSFELKNGSLILDDKTTNKIYSANTLNISTALNLEDKNISTSDLKVSGNLLDKFTFNLNIPNISLNNNNLSIKSFSASLAEILLQGSATIDLKSLSGNASLNSNGIELEKITPILSDFVPNLGQFGLKGSISPNIDIKLNGIDNISASGTVSLAKIAVSQGIFSVKDLAGNIALKANSPSSAEINSEDLNLNLNNQLINLKFLAKLAGNSFSLENFILNLLGGSINGKINLSLDESKAFSSTIQGSSISIEKALALINAEATKISGSVNSLSASVSGQLTADLMKSINGKANVSLENGELKGWNLAALVLKAVNNLPFLAAPLYSSVPDTSRSAVDSNNTAFNSLYTSFSFNGSGLNLESLKMLAPIFVLEADGKLGFDSSLDLSSTILFNSNFSSSLVTRVKELKNVLDDQGQLVLPLKIQGKAPLVIVYPNVKKLVEVAGKRIIINSAEDAVRGILQKKNLGGVGNLLGF